MKPQVTTLIVDLDNTLYDWFAIWSSSFEPVYDALVNKLSVDPGEIEREIRKIHQARRTSEYTFLLDELPFTVHGKMSLRDFFADALQKSKNQRDSNLKLYPSVLKTLWEIKRKGTMIVAYTESLAFYSAYRLKKLGLDGVIDYLYTPEDNDLPANISIDKIRSLPDEFYKLQITEVRHTPIGELKPNPKLLRKIIQDIGVKPAECAYIGDSLFKDVAMAQDAGVLDVYAEYGVSQDHEKYELLRRVSHWTNEDVERERATSKRSIKPSTSVDYFGELLTHFDFISFKNSASEASVSHIIDIWKTVVGVQQHFNDIGIKIRNYALTVVGAIMAAGGITFRDGLTASLFGREIPLSFGLAVIAIFIWSGFWFMDKHWYHRLLKGSVNHAIALEGKYGRVIPEISLGEAISKASPILVFGKSINSNGKVNIFYSIGGLIIVTFAVFSILATPTPHEIEVMPNWQASDAILWRDVQ